MNNCPIRRFLALATLAIMFAGCVSEKERWRAADSSNTISGYQEYLRNFPSGEFSAEARTRLSKLTNNAVVVIDHPASLTSQSSYHNVSGPVWVYTIKFLEVSGQPILLNLKQMQIHGTDGTVWGDDGYKEIYDSTRGHVRIKLNPYETDSYTSWVNDPAPNCQLCGSRMSLEYLGEDRDGKPLTVTTSFTLVK